jgi:hypothetical protein
VCSPSAAGRAGASVSPHRLDLAHPRIVCSAQISLANRLNAKTNQLPTSSAPSSSKDSSDSSSSDAHHDSKPAPASLLTMLPTLPGAAPPTNPARARNAPPFILANDSVRAVIHAVQTALGFAFMLVVMSVFSSRSSEVGDTEVASGLSRSDSSSRSCWVLAWARCSLGGMRRRSCDLRGFGFVSYQPATHSRDPSHLALMSMILKGNARLPFG